MRVPQRTWVDGRWTMGRGDPLVSVSPANADDVVLDAASTSPPQVDEAVAAAERALPAWRALPPTVRARHLGRAAAVARSRIDELARLVTREEGKILADARAEVTKGIDILEYFAGEGFRHPGTMHASDAPHTLVYTRREPLGVVALITPWNVPFALPCWKIAPALAAGNTAVLKPSNLAPGTSLALASIFEEAELPAGVLNVVIGSGAVVGRALAAHPSVRALSFTGSPGARRRLYEQVSERLDRFDWIAPAAGGKNAIVVLADADLDLAARGILHGAFASSGQRCTATSRVVVDSEVADALVERLVEGARNIVVGNGLDPDTRMGPVIDGRQLERLLGAVSATRDSGVPLAHGGRRLEEGALGRGFYLAPTIFDHVDPRARIAREELFGPVLTVTRVSGFDEALAVANDSPHRLAGAIYSSDARATMRFVDGAEARMVHVNAPTIGGEPHQPYGGIRATGIGGLAREGLDFFTELKTVFVDWGADDSTALRTYY